MKTYQIILRGHRNANISLLALRKHGDIIAISDRQLKAAGMIPEDFSNTRVWDTKTADYDIAHTLFRNCLMGSRYTPAHRLLARGGGRPDNLLAVSPHSLTSKISNLLHATTNKDMAGRAAGPGKPKRYAYGNYHAGRYW